MIAVYGASGHAKEIYDLICEVDNMRQRWEDIIFIDDTKPEGVFMGKHRVPFNVFYKEFESNQVQFLIGVGEPSLKKMLFDRVMDAGYSFTNLIHPNNHISPSVKMGKGVIVKRNVSISTDTILEDNICVLSNVTIGHDVLIKKHSQLASNVFVGGHVNIGEECYLGTGSMIREEIEVGNHSIISMGAVVLRSIPDNVTVIGNPARIVTKNSNSIVFKR